MRNIEKTGNLFPILALPSDAFRNLRRSRKIPGRRMCQVFRRSRRSETLYQQIRGFYRRLMVEVDALAVRRPLRIGENAGCIEPGHLAGLSAPRWNYPEIRCF